jgi:toxin ParE1/3/4
LFENSPENAEKLIRTIYEAPAALLIFPSRGRSGKEPGTREFVIPSLPYIVVYTVDPEIVHIVRILHGAQDRPTSI